MRVVCVLALLVGCSDDAVGPGPDLEPATSGPSADPSAAESTGNPGGSSTATAAEESSSSGGEAVCGDGILSGAELCDDGEETPACTAECTFSSCGDGYHNVAAGEACDDGNAALGDGCGAACQVELAVAKLVGGIYHTCALFEGGEMRCWGHNSDGQLGLGRVDDIGDDEPASDAPMLDLGAPVLDVSAGFFHTCALLEGGALRCFGYNEFGQLGLGTGELRVGDDERPLDVPAIELGAPAVAIGTGAYHTCALLEGGDVVCWGRNEHGELGRADAETIGDDESPASVAPVGLGEPATALVVGDAHACATLESGVIRCWGHNEYGQLGYGHAETIGDDEAPGEGALAIADPIGELDLGGTHSCARLGPEVRCWGDGTNGALGLGSVAHLGDDELPATGDPVALPEGAAELSVGFAHTCVRGSEGAVRCWGTNLDGQLGLGHQDTIGDDEPPSAASAVDIGEPVVMLAALRLHTCAVTERGTVRCWGKNDFGGLGYGHTQRIGDDEAPASAGDVPLF